MIPDNGRHEAVFRHPQVDGTHWTEHKPVVAWSDDGDALVVHENCLQIACNLADFNWIVEADMPVVGIASGGDWRMERRFSDGTIWDAPVIGWAVRADGTAFPLETDALGAAEVAGDGEFVIYHPGETPQTHRLQARTADSSRTENGTTP